MTVNGIKSEKLTLKNSSICLENNQENCAQKSAEKLEKILSKTMSTSNHFNINYRNLLKSEAFSFTQTFAKPEISKNPSKIFIENKTVNNLKLNFCNSNQISSKRSSSEDIKIINHLKDYNKNVFNSTFIRTNSTKIFDKSIEINKVSLPKVSVIDPLVYDNLMKNEYPCLDTIISQHKEEMVKMIPDYENQKLEEEPKKKFLENVRINSVYYTSFYNPFKIDASKFRHNYILKKNKK